MPTDGGYPGQSERDVVRRHPLLEKGTFEQLHRNDIIETRPHILHFGGFQVHKEHSHALRVLNISSCSLRLSIIGPSTPYFRINYDKKGLLAPGMSEEIRVTFSPHEWRYYYDTVKIFCGKLSENLVVPIHAYPSANDISLPRIVDFGRVALGTTRTKVIPLTCKIPIQFEYEVAVTESHPDFDISPLSGIIPSNDTTTISIAFHPTKHRTARAELQFNISQFDFEPVNVSLLGSCPPDLSQEEVLAHDRSEKAVAAAQRAQEQLSARVEGLKEKKSRAIQFKPPIIAEDVGEQVIDGVKVPFGLNHSTTNFVLNQRAGKLPLKDLSAFIREQAVVDDGRKAQDEAGDAQAQELRFEKQYRDVERRDKEKELKGMVAIGEDPPTDAMIAQIEESQKLVHQQILEHRFECDRKRIESVLSKNRVVVPDTFHSAVAPLWDENVNDAFALRLEVIDRFVRAGSKCLAQVRAQRNAEKLHKALRAAGVVDRATCKAWVDMENKAAAVGGRGRSGEELEGTEDGKLPAVRFRRGMVLPPSIPISASLMTQEDRVRVPVAPLGNFEDFKKAELHPRLDYVVRGYQKFKVPPPAAYMKPRDTSNRLNACQEEQSIRGVRGDLFDGAETPFEMPASCLLPPEHDPISLMVPSPSCRTYIGFPDFVECDLEYRLAQPPPLLEPLKTLPLIPPDINLDDPLLCKLRRRTLYDPFQHFDPFPANFAEGGGKAGPRLGVDQGGERLSFLPVGGCNRDIPSDTDSDERDDFTLPAPTQEDYEAAMKRLDIPLESELWKVKAEREDRLRALSEANNCYVRNRLAELNGHLDPRDKLFLG